MDLLYRAVVGTVLTGFKAMAWPITVSGAEHIPRSGGGVVAANHVSYLDFTFVGYGCRPQGRLLRFLAKKEIFDHALAGPLMRGMHHIPVDREGRAADSLHAAVEALRRGELIGMFPEATISRSFVPRPGKTGAARMAMEADVPLIPCAVWGGQRLLTKGRKRDLRRRVPISVLFDPPLPYERDEDPADVTGRLMERIRALVDRAAAEYPEQPRGEQDRWWLPAHLGGTAPTIEEAEAMAAAERAERRARRAAARGSAGQAPGS